MITQGLTRVVFGILNETAIDALESEAFNYIIQSRNQADCDVLSTILVSNNYLPRHSSIQPQKLLTIENSCRLS